LSDPAVESFDELLIRVYTDDMVPPWFSAALQGHGFDCVCARDVGNSGLPDEDHLAWATAENRLLFSCNVADPEHNFQQIHVGWLAEGRSHAGILLCPQEQVSRRSAEVLQRLVQFLNRFSRHEVADQLLWLP
jgi:hypothetical protein